MSGTKQVALDLCHPQAPPMGFSRLHDYCSIMGAIPNADYNVHGPLCPQRCIRRQKRKVSKA